jgi:hypothetical protein
LSIIYCTKVKNMLAFQPTSKAFYEPSSGNLTVIRNDNTVQFSLHLSNVACVGLSPMGSAVATATKETDSSAVISIYDPQLRCRIIVPWTPQMIAVNNTMSSVAMVARTSELPYDVVLIYNVIDDQMISVFHNYGKQINQLRFMTNRSLKINDGGVLVDV